MQFSDTSSDDLRWFPNKLCSACNRFIERHVTKSDEFKLADTKVNFLILYFVYSLLLLSIRLLLWLIDKLAISVLLFVSKSSSIKSPSTVREGADEKATSTLLQNVTRSVGGAACSLTSLPQR